MDGPSLDWLQPHCFPANCSSPSLLPPLTRILPGWQLPALSWLPPALSRLSPVPAAPCRGGRRRGKAELAGGSSGSRRCDGRCAGDAQGDVRQPQGAHGQSCSCTPETAPLREKPTPGRITHLTPLLGEVSYFSSCSNKNYRGCPGSFPCPEAKRSVPVPFLHFAHLPSCPRGASQLPEQRLSSASSLFPAVARGSGRLPNTRPTAGSFFLHRGRCGPGSSTSHKLSAKAISV